LGRSMVGRGSGRLLGVGVFFAVLFGVLSAGVLASPVPQLTKPGMPVPGSDSGNSIGASIRVFVTEPSGEPAEMALVTLSPREGGMFRQATTEAGQVEFDNLVAGDYGIQVIAASFQTVLQNVNANAPGVMVHIMLKAVEGGAANSSGPPAMPLLAPKAQKLVAKAVEALRAGKLDSALGFLDDAHHLAPAHPYIEYLFGIYSARKNDWNAAEEHWQAALKIMPNHLDSLLSMGDALLRQNRVPDALPYINRAVEAAPTSWQPHAMLAQAQLMQKNYDDALHEADRAQELGHSQAASVQVLSARILYAQGNKEKAVTVLEAYLRDHPTDAPAQKMLNFLRPPAPAAAAPDSRP